MKPLLHCKNSVRLFGGTVDDYMKFHEWMDHTKAHVPDMRHRMVLHNSWGIYMGQQVFGTHFKNSDGYDVSIRDVLEHHVIEDLGHIPTLEKCLAGLDQEPWMGVAKIPSTNKIRLSRSNHNIKIVD